MNDAYKLVKSFAKLAEKEKFVTFFIEKGKCRTDFLVSLMKLIKNTI